MDLQYSSAGRPGRDGKLALLRLLAAGDSGEIQIKADDVLKPGTYPLTTRAIWASSAKLDGHLRNVQGGELKIEAIHLEGDSSHVKGSTRFTIPGGASGHCEFDLPVFVMDRLSSNCSRRKSCRSRSRQCRWTAPASRCIRTARGLEKKRSAGYRQVPWWMEHEDPSHRRGRAHRGNFLAVAWPSATSCSPLSSTSRSSPTAAFVLTDPG